jgi:hypothetical protein
MTASRLLLPAIAALALAGAAHAQETDSHVANMGEQGCRRFASLCQDQTAACDAAFRFGALVGADAAMRCALAGDHIACFKNTMNSQEFMEEERKAIPSDIRGQLWPRSCHEHGKSREGAVDILGIGPSDETKREAVARFIIKLAEIDGGVDAASLLDKAVMALGGSIHLASLQRTDNSPSRRESPRLMVAHGFTNCMGSPWLISNC